MNFADDDYDGGDADAAAAAVASGPPLVLDVSVQSSRFSEAATTTINLHGVTIAVGGGSDDGGSDSDGDGEYHHTAKRELLVDADLSLAAGTRYALIGRNGTGKSILLKVLASGTLFDPDTQLALRIQLISQSFAPPPTPDWTVQDEVNTPPFGFDLSDALDEGRRAERRSEMRSGTRGKEAREAATAGKHSYGGAGGGGGRAEPVTYDVDLPTVAEILPAFKLLDIPPQMLEQRYSTLSGGWRMRVILAKALIYQPQILLLDEPTNHLDIAGINHLITLLKSKHFADTTIIFVSHDLHFVNELAESVIQLQDCKLTVAKGNWDSLQRERSDRKKFTDMYAAEQEKEKDRLLSSIEASMRKAGKDDKLKKQLASRRDKALERGSGMMRNSKGHRFRKNDDENAGYHLTLLDAVEVIRDERPVSFKFESPALGRGSSASSSSSIGTTLLAIDGLLFAYTAAAAAAAAAAMSAAAAAAAAAKGAAGRGKGSGRGGKASNSSTGKNSSASARASSSSSASSAGGVFSLQLPDLNLASGERVVLLGPNGHGKSTLLRLIVGELTPAAGTARVTSPEIGYFEQHCVSRLGGERRTALQYILGSRKASGHASGSNDDEEEAARKMLGSFGLGPHMGTPVALLSGGQRVALEFVLIALRRPALLLLDEPSAHLDLQAREALANALAAFVDGAILFISHDIGFVELAKPTRALMCKQGRFTPVAVEDWKRVALAL